MDFTTAIAEVRNIVKRPDKQVEMAFQLNRAISFFTLKADFSKDLVESSLPIDPTLYGQTISLSTFPRFRKLKYLKPTSARYYLTEIGIDKVLTPGESIQLNRYFIAGSDLTITLSKLDSSLEIGYYTYAPILTETSPNNTHWMLDIMPYAVIEKAASKIFQSIGDDASARLYEGSATEFFLAARRDFADQTAA